MNDAKTEWVMVERAKRMIGGGSSLDEDDREEIARNILALALGEDNVARYGPWIEWSGGKCPVEANELVQIRIRDGSATHKLEPASFWLWSHGDDEDAGDIIAYRVRAAAPPPSPEAGEEQTDLVKAEGVSDIVTRMRTNADDFDCIMPPFMRTNCHQAADAIETLRARLQSSSSQIDRLTRELETEKGMSRGDWACQREVDLYVIENEALKGALRDLADAARNSCNAAQHTPLVNALFEADRLTKS